MRPLEGFTIIDLTRLYPGAFCTLMLADYGGRVIKVEPPGGDPLRAMAPAAFRALHRDKTLRTLDLKEEAGREALLALLSEADVLVESFRPGVMERLGLGADLLRERDPRLVICSLTGYGAESPRAQEAMHDLNALALAGLLDGIAGPLTVQMADLGGAMSAAGAILAALLRRERDGQGGWIDAALLDAALFAGVMLRAGALERGTPPDLKREMLSGGLACYHLYRTGDGRAMALGALEPKFFAAFCTLAGRPDLIPHQLDPARQDWLKAELGALFAGKTQAEWAALIAAGGADSCCTPVLNILEAADDPSVRGRGLWFEDEQGTGHTRTVPPIR